MAGLKGSAVEVLGSSASMSQPLRSWLVQRVMSMFQLVLGCSVDLVIYLYIYIHTCISYQITLYMYNVPQPYRMFRLSKSVYGVDGTRVLAHFYVLPEPAVVTTSLPQGDAISPMALALLLAWPTCHVATIPGIRQTVFGR